jgi:ribosomal protein S18 acetylase RimI-like enzyme
MTQMTTHPTDHTVRQLSSDDAEAFRALRLESLRVHPEAFGASYEEECDLPLSDFQTQLDRFTVFGGFVGASLAGIAMLQRNAQKKRQHVAMIWGMYVREEQRGTGLARSILDAVIARAEQEVDQLELYVAVSNPRANRLYQALGFERFGVMRRSLRVGGVDHDADMMVKIFR